MTYYGPLGQIAVGSTIIFALGSGGLKTKPVLINLWLGVVVLVALVVYAFMMGLNLIQMLELLWKIVFEPTVVRRCLLIFFAINVLASFAFAVVVSMQERSSTIHRKFFHLTISLIYISGLFVDRDFVWLCGWLMICIFVILEVLRYCDVPPWSETLNQYLLVFRDSQDSMFLLTPIYLLIGIFMPLFLAPNEADVKVYHLAGVAAVGVGDSFAAIVGSTLGRTRWPGRVKTVEGTIAMSASIIIFLATTSPFCADPHPSIFYTIALSILLALLEAFVVNVDNVFLPFIAYLLL